MEFCFIATDGGNVLKMIQVFVFYGSGEEGGLDTGNEFGLGSGFRNSFQFLFVYYLVCLLSCLGSNAIDY